MYLFDGIPIEHVIVGEALPMEKISNKLTEVSVVGLLFESERSTVVYVGRELGWGKKQNFVCILSFF